MKSSMGHKKRNPLRSFSALLVLMGFVFVVLLVSFSLAGTILYVLIHKGIIVLSGLGNFPVILTFLLLVSLAISTIFSAIGGTLYLRPLRKLNQATREVAGGNFDIHVEASGPYEMQRLTESFNQMATELNSIETLRSDFVSNVSHEFKTPVASIRGFARLLKRDNLTQEQRGEYADVILLESERLSQLSSNVLLLSKLESSGNTVEKADYSLDEQLRQTVLLLDPQIEKKQLEIDARLEPLTIHGSEELLQHVWLNLLGNAIKFTPEGGAIHIKAFNNEGTVTVAIEDTGPGMDEEVRKHLFDKFYQGDASRATQGNGLGLALVKQILTLSGGDIAVQSAEGAGSTFTVTLPKAGGPAGGKPA